LPFYLALMVHLARHGIPCPAPIADLDDRYLSSLNGKPAALVTRLEGASVDDPGPAECAELGGLLGRMHLAARSYGGYMENPRGPKWWRSAAAEVRPFLDPPRAALLDEEMRFQLQHRFPDLPRGAVHADLFRDNAFFRDGGVFDFYFAGIDYFICDLAVCQRLVSRGLGATGSWTRHVRGRCWARTRLCPLKPAERAAWPVMRRRALRFWLSRLHDKHLPRPGELVGSRPGAFPRDPGLRAPAAQAPWTG
jgi:homoserine kinase type II